jgi:hypothetical protein
MGKNSTTPDDNEKAKPGGPDQNITPRSPFPNLQVYETSRQNLKSTVDLRISHVLGIASPRITL